MAKVSTPLADKKAVIPLKELLGINEYINVRNTIEEKQRLFFGRLGRVQDYALRNKDDRLFKFIRALIEVYQSDYQYDIEDKALARHKLEDIVQNFESIVKV